MTHSTPTACPTSSSATPSGSATPTPATTMSAAPAPSLSAPPTPWTTTSASPAAASWPPPWSSTTGDSGTLTPWSLRTGCWMKGSGMTCPTPAGPRATGSATKPCVARQSSMGWSAKSPRISRYSYIRRPVLFVSNLKIWLMNIFLSLSVFLCLSLSFSVFLSLSVCLSLTPYLYLTPPVSVSFSFSLYLFIYRKEILCYWGAAHFIVGH